MTNIPPTDLSLSARLNTMAQDLLALSEEVRACGSDFHADCVTRAAKDCLSAARSEAVCSIKP